MVRRLEYSAPPLDLLGRERFLRLNSITSDQDLINCVYVINLALKIPKWREFSECPC